MNSLLNSLSTARGFDSEYVDARGWLVTDDSFGNANVLWPESVQALAERNRWGHAISVHTGFIGRTVDGRTTTLGRNGSDYTATLLGRGLAASEVVICTDVPGVMTGDPGIVADARSRLWLSTPRGALRFDHDGSARHTRSGTWVRQLEVDALEISSSEVRERLREGLDVRYLLPEVVHDDILESGVYTRLPAAAGARP